MAKGKKKKQNSETTAADVATPIETQTENVSTPVDAIENTEATQTDVADEQPAAEAVAETPEPEPAETVVQPAADVATADDDAGGIEIVYDPHAKLWTTPDRLTPLRLDENMASDSPYKLSLYDQETVRLINEKAAEVADKEAEYIDAHGLAGRLKKSFEAMQTELRELIKERAEQRGKPEQPTLFGRSPTYANDLDSPDNDVTPDDWAASRGAESFDAVTMPAAAPAEDKPDDSWKAVTLRELVEKDGLPAKVAELLEANGLDTLGKVTEYTDPNASGWCKKLTDFKGFGPKKLEEFEQATANYWGRRSNEERKRRDDAKNNGPSIEGSGRESESVGSGDDSAGTAAGSAETSGETETAAETTGAETEGETQQS